MLLDREAIQFWCRRFSAVLWYGLRQDYTWIAGERCWAHTLALHSTVKMSLCIKLFPRRRYPDTPQKTSVLKGELSFLQLSTPVISFYCFTFHFFINMDAKGHIINPRGHQAVFLYSYLLYQGENNGSKQNSPMPRTEVQTPTQHLQLWRESLFCCSSKPHSWGLKNSCRLQEELKLKTENEIKETGTKESEFFR